MKKSNMQTVERQTADAVFERVKAITIGGVEYVVAPPTLATLILVSEEVSYLPHIDFNGQNTISDALRDARHFEGLADIAATLILGAQRIEVEEEHTYKMFGIIPRKRKVKVDMKARLADKLLNVPISDLSTAVATLLSMMQVEHFFALATFLTNINLTKPTKVAKTTASGR